MWLARSDEDGRWQWCYATWFEGGSADDIPSTYRSDHGMGDCRWPRNGLHALTHRLNYDAEALGRPGPF